MGAESPGDDLRRGSRNRSFAPPPTITIDYMDMGVVKTGFLYFKVSKRYVRIILVC